jgi:hypothetical protein
MPSGKYAAVNRICFGACLAVSSGMPVVVNRVVCSSRLEVYSPYPAPVSVILTPVLDERFIVKEISRFEGDSFGEIGPAYFSYLSTCFTTGVRL